VNASYRAFAAAAAVLVPSVSAEGQTKSTTLPGVQVFGPLPAQTLSRLNSMTNDQLIALGIPPRPDPALGPNAAVEWADRISKLKRITPSLQRTNVRHGPALIAPDLIAKTAKLGATVATTSGNWSGSVLLDPSGGFGKPATQVEMQLIVPQGHCDLIQPPKNTYSSHWVGIDGWGSSDVFQAGVSANVGCSKYPTPPSRDGYAWFEWYPEYEVKITNFPVRPGDLVMVSIVLQSPTTGMASFQNMDTFQTTAVSFKAPAGTTISGNSIEWIAERPGVNGAVAPLANYKSYVMTSAISVPGGGAGIIYTPVGIPSGTTYNVTLIEDGQPVSLAFPGSKSGIFADFFDALTFTAHPH
jgi:hypothetical protein